jgi:hypothetical protein
VSTKAKPEPKPPLGSVAGLRELLQQPTASVSEVYVAALGAMDELRKKGMTTKLDSHMSRLAAKCVGGVLGLVRKRPELAETNIKLPTIAFLTNRNDGRNACAIYPKRSDPYARAPWLETPPETGDDES